MRDFAEDQMRSSGNQRFQVWEVTMRIPMVSSTLKEVGNSSYLVLFSIFRLELVRCLSSYRASFA